MTHPIPDAVLEQHTAILGKTGSGKTSTAKLAIEQVVPKGARVCVLDAVKSDWWGLTSSADGNRPGLPFHILGGPHGHVPLHSSAGKAIGELVATGALPLSIIDMADFEAGGLQRFFVDFAPALLRKMRGVIYLVMEEAHEFAPKERAGFGAENMAIHWAKKLATAGRSKGIRLILATQRVQSLHNALLGSCDTMIAHRLTAPADQEPVLKWLKANAAKEVTEKVSKSLSSLRTGTGWICSGEARVFELVQFPRISTYDNSATPTADAGEHKVTTAPVDHDRLRAIIGDAVKEAEADDPKALRAEIARLKRDLADAGKIVSNYQTDPRAINEAERRGEANGRAIEAQLHSIWVHQFVEGFGGWVTEFKLQSQRLADRAEALGEQLHQREQEITNSPPALPPTNARRAGHAPTRTVDPVVPRAKPSPEASGDGSLSGPQLRMLRSLAWWRAMGHERPSRVQVASIAGWRVTSGHLKNVAGSLRTLGLIDYPADGAIAMTAAGVAAAPVPDTSTTLEDSVRAILTGPQLLAFDCLPKDNRALSREQLAKACGWEPTSGHVKNVLGSMRSLEVIDYPSQGMVARGEWLLS